jgi:hypothetical protein
MQNAKCKVQNAKVRLADWQVNPHFAFCTLHFAFSPLPATPFPSFRLAIIVSS